MAVEVVGGADHLDDAAREHGGILRPLGVRQDDGELVSAEARDGVDLAHAGPQPVGHGTQEHVADRVAEGVVDLLEAVEVEAQHRERVAAAEMGDRLLDALAEHRPVRQAGEDVVAGHEGDAGVGLPLLGHVLEGRHEAAAAHGLVRDRHNAAVAEVEEIGVRCAPGRRLGERQGEGVGGAGRPFRQNPGP